jgi:adenylate kinase
MTAGGADPATIVLLGPPGAGKGTQARLLSERFGLPHISTGEILRRIAAADTPLGREVRAIQKAGLLVDDAVMARLVLERTEAPDCRNGFILDGFPRTIGQAKLLETLHGADRRPPVAVAIVVPAAALVRRLTGRRSCPSCGTIYNVYTSPPRVADVCNLDGAALVQRSDDTEEAAAVRIAEYEIETAPLFAFYEGLGRLITVDGARDPDEIFADLEATLGRVL